jgi:hypothetical protein
MKMPETARYTALVAKNNKQAAVDMSRVLQVEFSGTADLSGTVDLSGAAGNLQTLTLSSYSVSISQYKP